MNEYYISVTSMPTWDFPRIKKEVGIVKIFLNQLYISLSESQVQELVDALAKVGIKADPMTQEEAEELATKT